MKRKTSNKDSSRLWLEDTLDWATSKEMKSLFSVLKSEAKSSELVRALDAASFLADLNVKDEIRENLDESENCMFAAITGFAKLRQQYLTSPRTFEEWARIKIITKETP